MFERIVGFFGAAIGAIWLRCVYSSLVNSSFVRLASRRTPGYSATETTDPFVFLGHYRHSVNARRRSSRSWSYPIGARPQEAHLTVHSSGATSGVRLIQALALHSATVHLNLH